MTDKHAATLALIEFDRVRKAFGAAPPVLDDASFRLERGQFAQICGANGAGKTTVLRLVSGWLRPDAGRVAVAGEEPTRLRDAALATLRRAIGMVPQDLRLLEDRSVLANVMLPALADGLSQRAAAQRARLALQRVGLAAEAQRPAELSAAARQRAALARALVNGPALLLVDAPTAFLDAAAAVDLLRLLDEFSRAGMAVLMASQDEAAPLPPQARRLRLADGRIIE